MDWQAIAILKVIYSSTVIQHIKGRKNDRFRDGHRPRNGVTANPDLDIKDPLTAFWRQADLARRKDRCNKRTESQPPWLVCPPIFQRSFRNSTALDLSRL